MDRIQNPILIAEGKVVFIGYKEGFSNIYIADLESANVEALTNRQSDARKDIFSNLLCCVNSQSSVGQVEILFSSGLYL